ncbi:MAG: hypothetical protein M3177_07855 [Pseudomonadota bacterium]|nr:hypothetical protein [Pseudomonadota bacterium]
MTSLALRPLPPSVPALTELFDRQRTLAAYGLALLALAVLTLVAQSVDARTLESGVNIWVKPTKFFVSVGVFALTTAWFFGYVRPDRRRSRPMRAVVALTLIAGTFELAWISWQAAQALESHFNMTTIFHAVMYALMGVFSVLLIGTTLPLAWEIARRPAAGLRSEFVAAVAIGLVLTFVLGTAAGAYMSAQAGHAVGAQGGHVPFFGWNRSGGDLRIAHFLGVHAEQAIPLLAFTVAGLSTRARWAALAGGTALYVTLTLGLFAQAIAGRPLLPL